MLFPGARVRVQPEIQRGQVYNRTGPHGEREWLGLNMRPARVLRAARDASVTVYLGQNGPRTNKCCCDIYGGSNAGASITTPP